MTHTSVSHIIRHIRDGAPGARYIEDDHAGGMVWLPRLCVWVNMNGASVAPLNTWPYRPGWFNRLRIRIALKHWYRTHRTCV